LSGPLLRLALKLSASDEQDPVRELLAQIRGVQVRSYEFKTDHAYSQEDVDRVRKQLATPAWSQVVKIRSPKDQEQVDVYICLEAGKPKGLAIISAERRELTIVNIVGSIDIEQLVRVQDQLGIPKFSLGH
jgi:hypothetical protein